VSLPGRGMSSGCGPAAVLAWRPMRLAVLGPTVLDGPDGEIALNGAKARQILTALALSAPERWSVDELIELVWAEPPPSAAKTVQAHVSRLRAALAAAGAPHALTGTGGGYQLQLGDRLDLHAVTQLTRRATAMREGGDARLAAELLADARRLWRGAPELPGTPAGDALRRRWDEQRTELAIAHLGALIEAGSADEAVAELGELVAEEPLHERLWELRILALHRSGRSTEALRAFQEISSLLAEEVGVVPGPALRALEAAILAHDDELLDGSARIPSARIPSAPAVGLPVDDIAYARAGDTHIAYRCFGTGDGVVLLINPGLISVDTLLDESHMASAIGRLADGRRVVAFDPRGMGLSDRSQPPDDITIADWVEDACAVLDTLGLDEVDVFASGHGGLVAMMLAGEHGHRVRSLTIVNGFARFTRADDHPHGLDAAVFMQMQRSLQSIDSTPGVDALTLISPTVAADPVYRAWWDNAGRRAASPATAAALVTKMVSADVRRLLPAIEVPCLLVIRVGCPAYDPTHGEHLAANLVNAVELVVERHHDVNEPWWVGDTNRIVVAFEGFLRGLPPR
jgi:DNA-binding SARP family transcriptional activator/pimeloyl-ACP methyl ester carboxylesterase